MKTYFYTFLFTLLFFSTSIAAQQNSQRNYLDSVNYIEVPTISDNTEKDRIQHLLDSLQKAQEVAVYQAWYEKNKNSSVSSENARITCTTDSLALVALYNATNGANWTTTWDLSQSMDTWHGVTLNGNGCVTDLSLTNNNLEGSLPNEIGDLSALLFLNLYYNSISGSLPNTMANLNQLLSLNLFSNKLSGGFPTVIGTLSNLELLDLEFNRLDGTIPEEIGNLIQLEILRLGINQFTGAIPKTLGNLTNLRVLSIGYNGFTELPSSLENLNNLNTLVLNGLKLSIFPTWIANLTELKQLFFSGNNLSGDFPTEIQYLDKLEALNLSYNQLSGDFPTEIQYLDKLKTLNLSHNQLSGSIPVWIGGLADLYFLVLSGNQFSGDIPAELGDLVNLNFLFLEHNSLTSCPDLSTDLNDILDFLIADNNLSFDDLLPNATLFDYEGEYAPQNKFGTSYSLILNSGDSHTISFGIDGTINNNTYSWYRNGIFLTSTTDATLTITNMSIEKAGNYHCEVTNPGLPDLILESHTILLNMNITGPPPNDACPDAIMLTMGNFVCSGPITGYNIGATDSNNDDPVAFYTGEEAREDVWYQLTVPPSGVFGMDINKGSQQFYNVWFSLFTGDCTNLSDIFIAKFGREEGYSEVFSIAPAGTTLYMRLWYGNSEGNPDIFNLCVYEFPCKEPNIGWTEVSSCNSETEFYFDFNIYDFGGSETLTFKSVNNPNIPSLVINSADFNVYSTTYRVGPFISGQENLLAIINSQDAICNDTIYLYGSPPSEISNARPCSAIDISQYIGGIYTYAEGTLYNTPSTCSPTVNEVWRNNLNYDGSEWFRFEVSQTTSLSLGFSTSNYNFRTAVWEAASCTDISEGEPILIKATEVYNFGHNPFVELPCLEGNKTYYLQVANSNVDYSISLTALNLPCGNLPNDQSENAIPMLVQDQVCSVQDTFFNIGATDSNNDVNAPTYLDTYGADVWFKAKVPASGNLALVLNSLKEGAYISSIINLYAKNNGMLDHLSVGHISGENTSQGQVFFEDLPVSDSIYIAIDFRNNFFKPDYFQLCLLDPPCLPVKWGSSESIVSCDNSEQYFIDVSIFNKGTTPTFSIVDPTNNVIFYEDLTDTRTYRIGPFTSQYLGTIQILSDNGFCDSKERPFPPLPSHNAPSNDHICNAIWLNPIINQETATFTGTNASREDCEPAIPFGQCNSGNGWEYPFGFSTWTFFDAISNNMKITIKSVDDDYFVNMALWKAATCADFKASNRTLIKAVQPCFYGEAIVLDFDNLEIGQRYFVLVHGWSDYTIQLESSPPTDNINCEDTDLIIPTANKQYYNAENTITSTATLVETPTYFTAGQSITLAPGFHAQAGGMFSAYILPCIEDTPDENITISDFPWFQEIYDDLTTKCLEWDIDSLHFDITIYKSGDNYFILNGGTLHFQDGSIHCLIKPDDHSCIDSLTEIVNKETLVASCRNFKQSIPPISNTKSTGISSNSVISLKVFPNPAAEKVFIELPNTTTETSQQLTLLDLNGRSLFTSNSSNSFVEWDVSTFASGLYLIRWKTSNEVQTVRLIIE